MKMSNPIFSQHAETAVLSILLRDPTSFEELEELRDGMFSSTPNQFIFEAVRDLIVNGLNPEYSLLITSLQSKNRLELCGGESHLNYLMNQNYDRNNLSEFIRIIVNSYKARELLSIGSQIPEMISNNSSEIDNALAYIQNKLDDITVGGDGESIADMDSATKDVWEDIIEKVENPNKIDATTGFKNLDAVTGGYWADDLWVIAGRPGMGKSSFMCNSILTGIPSLIFSLEMSKLSILYRLLAMSSGVPVFNIRMGILTQKQLDLISDTVKEIKDLPIYIDASFIRNIDYVTSTIRKYKNSHGIKVSHVDYIQLLAERSVNATHELGRISRELKILAKDLKMTNVTYSQLNRGVELRDDKRPILSDLRQSGNLEEDADIVMFLYRDELYNKDTKDKGMLELLIRKQRNGPIGTVFSKFDVETNKIMEK
jgi:replicative DNA helicase